MGKIKYSQDQLNKVLQLRKEYPNLTVNDLVKLTGVNKARIKRLIISNKDFQLTPEQRQKNAYKSKLEKNPNAMEDMRKKLTPEVIEKRNANVRKYLFSNKNSELQKERWNNLTEEQKKDKVQKLRKNTLTHPNYISYLQKLKSGVGRNNNKSISILKIEGFDNFEERMSSWANSHGGKFIGPYKDSRALTYWKCSNPEHPEFLMRPNSVRDGQWCIKCSNNGTSNEEIDVREFIQSVMPNNEIILNNYRYNLNSKETLDVFIPRLMVGIEYNGNIYHSSCFVKDREARHYLKFKRCTEVGINLFAFFSDEWINKKDLIKSMIKHRLHVSDAKKVRASDCEVKRLYKNSEFSYFFNDNHLDGHSLAMGAYGLFLDNKMVMCASFRLDRQKNMEIARMATDYNYFVFGGASKLLKNIINEFNCPIISCSDNRLSNGNVYRKIGFEFLNDIHFGYWYTDGKIRIENYKCKRINEPEIISRFPTEELQALNGVFSKYLFNDSRSLYKIEDYGHKKWIFYPK